MRWLSLAAGFGLIVIAVAAVTRVEDTRQGLIAEIVTLFAALAGVSLLIYGLVARRDLRSAPSPRQAAIGPAARPRSVNDLKLGSGGVALALILLVGLAISGGMLWAVLGFALLLPMISGCVYLCLRYLRASP